MTKKRVIPLSILLLVILAAYGVFRHFAVTQVYRSLHENRQEIPTLLKEVFPAPGEQIFRPDEIIFLAGSLDYGVCADLNIIEILEPGDYKHFYDENMRLIVDGIPQVEGLTTAYALDEEVILWDEAENRVAIGPSDYVKCWYPFLLPGRTHYAEIIVTTTSGIEYRYRWAFTTRH